MKLEIRKIGNSAGLILPKELMARLGLEIGDELVVNETPDGFAATRGDEPTGEEFERELEIARDIMRRYSTTLKALAK